MTRPLLLEIWTLFCWPAIATVRPTRQSERPAADASGNRRFVFPPGPPLISTLPGPGNCCRRQGVSLRLPVPFKGGRSAARRGASVGMLVHPLSEQSTGGGLRGPAARGSAASGREGNEPHQRRVRAPDACVTESPSVHHVPDKQRRARCGAWCEERAFAAAGAGACDKPGASFLPTGNNVKQRSDVIAEPECS
jgi:hypothetical protein